jgi:glucose-1-phosphate cytidylyltransferase
VHIGQSCIELLWFIAGRQLWRFRAFLEVAKLARGVDRMKAVILAGGLGTRISEETHLRPKPMIEIGGKPILWHIMKMYAAHGVNDFVICCGYKGYVIKEYFANYFLHMSDVTFDMASNRMEVHHQKAEPWRVTLVDTGEDTLTGGRLRRVAEYLKDEEAFCFTYGDGVSDLDITKAIAFHVQHGKLATVTAVQPPGRYGALQLNGSQVTGFYEKPRGDGGLINGGFFVLSPSCIDLVDGDMCSWEGAPLTRLAIDGQLMAFEHHGFWQPMDTLREKNMLEDLWASGKAPWKVWS